MRGVDTHITPFLNTYRKSDPHKLVTDTIKQFGDTISGDWYDNTNITLFAKTPRTYTLSIESNGYSGGAHGYYTIAYINIDTQTQKQLSLSNLFLPKYKQKLHNIALAYYKIAHNLKPSDPLTQDGWFDNKFMLAENFAITPQGLYFLYNQYEIKPYADGQTNFLLPYAAIQKIIDPKGLLAFALNASNNSLKATYANEQMKLSAEIKRRGDTVTLTAHLTPRTSAKAAWLSVSLPQIDSKRQLLSTGYKGFDHVVPYDTRNSIYNGALNKSMHARYMLVEADKRNVDYDKRYTMWFRFKVPHKLKTLIIDIRATLKNDKMTYTLPEEYEGVKGQQGFKNYRLVLPL